MESAARLDQNHQLTLKEFPYIIKWREHRCTRCGRCTAVCPMQSIEPVVQVQRLVRSEGDNPSPKISRTVSHVVKQVTDIERYCIGCGTCTLVCPTDAIFPEYNFQHKFYHFKNKGGVPYMRGGRRNDPSVSTLDKLKFTRISMLTDPALAAGRHEFRIRTLLGRNLPAEQPPIKVAGDRLSLGEGTFIPPVRKIYPIRIGSMSIGALFPHMWEGLAMGIAYPNEVEGLPRSRPIAMTESGVRSAFLVYG